MKLEVYNYCMESGFKIDGESGRELSRRNKISIINRILKNANDSDLDEIITTIPEIALKTINYEEDDCEQCGNWNTVYTYEI